MNEIPTQHPQEKNRVSARWLFLLVIGMFGFGFAMVPLYNLLCSVTGLNGSTTGRIQEEQALTRRVDFSRTITVEFDATNNADLPWEFHPMVKKVDVHPGEIMEVSYFAKNNSNRAIIAQAIPGITPWQATEHFNKTECFCFAKQKLEPGESKEMPLRFVIDPDLPEGFTTITLSYTFMDTDRTKLKKVNALPELHSSLSVLPQSYSN
ncbi:MAG TPA: cytochrome c oxidase assembly protein [Gammaproteobacteria bacterium]|nr:cytochrome c oxidase assembly protein [Gammaproteobacteria bacterium]